MTLNVIKFVEVNENKNEDEMMQAKANEKITKLKDETEVVKETE